MTRPVLKKVIYKGEQITALNEILGDYISILQHSYKSGAAALSARKYAVEHPEMISKEMLEKNPNIIEDLKKEIEIMEKDLPHIEVAITRAMQLQEQLPLTDNNNAHETDSVQSTGTIQDADSGDKPDAEVPESA